MRILQIFLILIISLSAEVGYLSAVIGDVSIERNNQNLKAKIGFKIEEKDIISTSSNGKIQIVFNDKTTIRLGRRSTLDIEEYFFNKSENSVAHFRVKKGFFDVVTGGISKYARQNFKLKLGNSTIGVRGTHFQGYDLKDKNEIRCISGAITLTIDDEVFNLVAGEKAELTEHNLRKKEKIDDHKTLEKIYNIELDEDITRALNNLRNSNIVESADSAAEAFNQLQEIRNSMEYKYAQSVFEKSIFESLYDSYVYTKGEQIDLTDQFVENADDSLVKIGNYELEDYRFWIDGRDYYTDYISVTEAMGGFTETGDFLPAWSGYGENRKIGVYQGFFGNGNDSIANSPITLTLDFGNRAIFTNVFLENKNISFIELNGLNQFGLEEIKQEYVVLYEIEELVEMYNLTEFELELSTSYLDIYNSEDLAKALVLAYSNYYGENMEQIAGSLLLVSSTTGGYYTLFFLAEQEAMLEVSKEVAGEDNIFSWGYWAYTDTDGIEKNRGGWILPKSEATSQELIEEYALNSISASYSGNVFGTYEKVGDVSPQKFEDGTFALNFNFSDNTINGNFNFEIDSSEYNVQTTGSMIDSSSAFDLTGTNFIGDGQLFGENAENIGGGFYYQTTNEEAVIGVFKGSQN